jgi:hypothetical protein
MIYDLLALFGVICLMGCSAVVFLMLIGGVRFNISIECRERTEKEGHDYAGSRVFKE